MQVLGPFALAFDHSSSSYPPAFPLPFTFNLPPGNPTLLKLINRSLWDVEVQMGALTDVLPSGVADVYQVPGVANQVTVTPLWTALGTVVPGSQPAHGMPPSRGMVAAVAAFAGEAFPGVYPAAVGIKPWPGLSETPNLVSSIANVSIASGGTRTLVNAAGRGLDVYLQQVHLETNVTTAFFTLEGIPSGVVIGVGLTGSGTYQGLQLHKDFKGAKLGDLTGAPDNNGDAILIRNSAGAPASFFGTCDFGYG